MKNYEKTQQTQIYVILVIMNVIIITMSTALYAHDCQKTYFVDPVNGNDSWNGRQKLFTESDNGPWKTIMQSNDSLKDGDCVYLLGGEYPESISPINSGTSETRPIIYSAEPGERVVITKKAILNGKKFIIIDNLQFQSSDSTSWVTTDKYTEHIQLINNSFDAAIQFKDFGGIALYGHHYVLRNNVFGRWVGDMIYIIEASHILIENNDFSQAAAGHAVIQILGKNVIIRNNYFRNPWSRVLSITWNGTIATEKVLVENNLFIDSDWNLTDPHPRQGGSGEVVLLNGNKIIFRNNLVIGSNRGKEVPWTGILSFTAFDSRSPYYYGYLANHFENIRVYHNTIYQNTNNAMVFTSQSQNYRLYAKNNIFVNNVIYQADGYILNIVVPYIPLETYVFESNIMGGQSKPNPLYLTTTNESQQVIAGEATLERAESLFPQVFTNNITQPPVFKDQTILMHAESSPQTFALKDLSKFFASFSLIESSPGSNAGKHLTTVRRSRTQTQQLQVEDTLYFSDGMDLIEGDNVLIGDNKVVKIKKILDGKTLLVDSSISVQQGDKVYLEKTGRNPSIGIYNNNFNGIAEGEN